VFGEMYNIKAISGILVKSPLKDDQDPNYLQDPKSPRAGPPFQMPFRLTLPPNERDTWRIHREAIATSLELCEKLLRDQKHPMAVETQPAARSYLAVLMQADRDALAWINTVFEGLR
jgi:hypothetical protein